MRPRDSHRSRAGSSAFAPCGRTAGCRPCVTPGTARHQLAAATPAKRALGTAILPGAPVLSRAKITVKGGACGAVIS